MFKATPELFLHMFYTQKKVCVEKYCTDETVFVWEEWDDMLGDVEISYLMSPKTAAKYTRFIKKLKKECPLLAELV